MYVHAHTPNRTKQVLAGQRVAWFQANSDGTKHLIGRGECTDDAQEKRGNPLGILGVLEAEMGVGQRAELAQLAGMRRRAAALRGALAERFRAGVAGDRAAARQAEEREAACQQACVDALRACEDDVLELRAELVAQEAELMDRLLMQEAQGRIKAELMRTCAEVRAAALWLASAIDEGQGSGNEDGDGGGPEEGGGGLLDWEGELVVEVMSAKNLPKMDLLGTCDAFACVSFVGATHETHIEHNDLNPVWEGKGGASAFRFRLEGATAPGRLAVLDGERKARGACVVVHVWDWDRMSGNDLVGVAEMGSEDVVALLQKGDQHTETRTLALMHSDGAAPAQVQGFKGAGPASVQVRLRVHHGASSGMRRGAGQAEPPAAGAGSVDGRGGDGKESQGTRWFDRELPQVKVDVLRCCGWKGEESAALAAEFKLLHEGTGAEDEGACQVLDSGKGAVPSSSKDILLGGPGFVLKASTPQGVAAAPEGSGNGEAAREDSAGVDAEAGKRLWRARSLKLVVSLTQYGMRNGQAGFWAIASDTLPILQTLATPQEALDLQRRRTPPPDAASKHAGSDEGGVGGGGGEHRGADEEEDRAARSQREERERQEATQRRRVRWHALAVRLLRLSVLDEPARAAMARNVQDTREQGETLVGDTRLVWLQLCGVAGLVMTMQVRLSFSDTVPFNGGECLRKERSAKLERARQALCSDVQRLRRAHEEAARARRAAAGELAADVMHTQLVNGLKPHGVGLVLSAIPPRFHRPPPPGGGWGLVVERVLADSPAAQCGCIHAGDVLVAVASGLKWESMGSAPPRTGTRLKSVELARLLANRRTLTVKEWAACGIREPLGFDDHIQAGPCWYRPARVAPGVTWQRVASAPRAGQELVHAQLAMALTRKVNTEGVATVSQEEWDGLGIVHLSRDHFVRSGDTYFKPADRIDDDVLEAESRIVGRQGSAVALRLTKGVSGLAYEVELERSGGVRIEFLQQWMLAEGAREAAAVRDRFGDAIATMRERQRERRVAGLRATAAAAQEEEALLRAQCVAAESAVLARAKERVQALGEIRADKERRVWRGPCEQPGAAPGACQCPDACGGYARAAAAADTALRAAARRLQHRRDDAVVALLAQEEHLFGCAEAAAEAEAADAARAKAAALARFGRAQAARARRVNEDVQLRRERFREACRSEIRRLVDSLPDPMLLPALSLSMPDGALQDLADEVVSELLQEQQGAASAGSRGGLETAKPAQDGHVGAARATPDAGKNAGDATARKWWGVGDMAMAGEERGCACPWCEATRASAEEKTAASTLEGVSSEELHAELGDLQRALAAAGQAGVAAGTVGVTTPGGPNVAPRTNEVVVEARGPQRTAAPVQIAALAAGSGWLGVREICCGYGVFIYIDVCAYMHICMCVCIYVCVCIYIYILMGVCICASAAASA